MEEDRKRFVTKKVGGGEAGGEVWSVAFSREKSLKRASLTLGIPNLPPLSLSLPQFLRLYKTILV